MTLKVSYQERKEQFLTWLKTEGKEPLPSDLQEFLEILKDYCIFGNQSPQFRMASELFKKAKIPDLDSLCRILSNTGTIQEDENLQLLKYHIPREFPPELEKEVSAVMPSFFPGGNRADLTHLDTFTMDDPATSDMDDALSFETSPNGYRVGIHIADVAEFIEKDTLLDREAHARSTSLYLPDQKIQMLPEKITGIASLQEREKRPTLSLLVTFNAQGQRVAWEIQESIIAVKQRLTYEDVECNLDHSPVFLKLWHLAVQLQEDRKKAGAMFLNLPRVEVHVDPKTREISITKPHPRLRSQILVSEWMILMNHLTAEFCRQSNLPAIYRTQPAPEKSLSPNEEDVFSLWKQRHSLRKAEATVIPSRHHGLGLPVYVQMTSPIRRYSDLVMQRQVKAFLKKQPLPYTTEDLAAILAYSEPWIEIGEIVERETRKFWLLKYLESKPASLWEAIVVEKKAENYFLFLPELALEVSCPKTLHEYKEGDKIQVKVILVKPRAGILKVLPC